LSRLPRPRETVFRKKKPMGVILVAR
jgi:hypothetical protein